MSIFIFAKTIADMFYSVAVLDYILMAIAMILFVLGCRRIHALHIEDYLAFAYMILLCLTMGRTGTGFNHFVKMLSGFMLFFIGRAYFKDVHNAEKALVLANYIVVFVNLALFVAGVGFITWGSASTFKGLYFYKSDFSIAMIYALSAFMFFGNPEIWVAVLEWGIISYLVLRSNTRIALIILVLVFGLWILYLREKKTNAPLKINLKYLLAALGVLVAAVFIIIKVLSLPVFDQYNFLSFEVSSVADLFNSANTQGRNLIWNNLLSKYRRATWLQKAIGIDFISDYWNGFDAHNAYLKILFSTGYIGLAVFICFLLSYIFRLNKLKDRSLFYFNLSILLTFIVQSISQSSIDFTQMTWVFLFFAGCAVSESCHGDTMEYRFNKRLRIVAKKKKPNKSELPFSTKIQSEES